MRTCDFCSKPIQDEAVYCRHCHRDLPPSPSLAGRRRCPYCAEWVPRGTLICPYCQKDLPRRVTPERAPEEAPPSGVSRPWPPEERLKTPPFIDDFTMGETSPTGSFFKRTSEETSPSGSPRSWEPQEAPTPPAFLDEVGEERLTAAPMPEQPFEDGEPSRVSLPWDSPGSVWRSLSRDEVVEEPEPVADLPREEEPEPPAPDVARPWDPREVLPSDEILEEPEETRSTARQLLVRVGDSLGLERPLDEVLQEGSTSAANTLKRVSRALRKLVSSDEGQGEAEFTRRPVAEGPRRGTPEPLRASVAHPEPESDQLSPGERLRAPAQKTIPSKSVPGDQIPVEPLGATPAFEEPADERWSGQFSEQEDDSGPFVANPPSASLWTPRPRPEPSATSSVGQTPMGISNPVLGPPPPPPPSPAPSRRAESRSPVDYLIAFAAIVLVGIVAILGLQSAGFNTPSWIPAFPGIGGNTPTRPAATPLPTLPASPTSLQAATATAVTETPTQPACLLWDQITLEDAGQTLCAYGQVKRWFVTGELPFVALFTEQPGTLYIVDRLTSYPEVSAGTCIMATGVVEVMSGARPFIDAAGNLLTCP
jgi:hypothetical protein